MPRILVVDDSILQRSIIRKILEPIRAEVVEAENGEDALGKLDGASFDCIVTDLLMPKMGGIPLMEKLREKGNSVPIIVITADIQETTKNRCIELGAKEFINKPGISQLLPDSVLRLLNGARG
jgi:twitching motility two-component system response regulator PilH